MTHYETIKSELIAEPKVWLITGVAGFIGSNLLEYLLKLNQNIVGLDNFATGYRRNIEEVKRAVSDEQWSRFSFIEGDITEYRCCKLAVEGVDFVLHQAALGSVPRSISDPITTNMANVSGFLNMLQAAKEAKVSSFTYAASSSTYGDHPALPKLEENIGAPLSPYAVTKYVNELYASVFALNYGFKSIGLRYFNVFGPRQDPNGSYAAVIPKWISAMLLGKNITINGDGETSRDFCYIENTIQMNILAATAAENAKNQVYNVAVGNRTTLNELHSYVRYFLENAEHQVNSDCVYKDFRNGDVRHSQADISKAIRELSYSPDYTVLQGLQKTIPWYISKLSEIS